MNARLLLLAVWCGAHALVLAADAVDVHAVFPERLAAWQAWCLEQPEQARLTDGPAFRALTELGAPAAPLLAAEMGKALPREAAALADGLQRVTGKNIPREAWPEGKLFDPTAKVTLYARWWTTERPRTRETFTALYARWRACKAKNGPALSHETITTRYDEGMNTITTTREFRRTELLELYTALKDMGVDILPLLVEQITAKNYDLLPLFGELAHFNGKTTAPVAQRAQAVLQWWEKNKERLVIPEQ